MTAQPIARGNERGGWLALAAVLAGALVYRLWLLGNDFPINDGALFARFIDDVAPVFPALPTAVPYNGLSIPFAYPPLAFWLAAPLARAGVDTIEILRVAPILLNIATVGLFAWLLHRLGYRPWLVAIATFFFVTNQRAWEWLVMGGGLPRSLGALLALAALIPLAGPGRVPRLPLPALLLSGAAVAGAVLSHPQWGIFAPAAALAVLAVRAPGFRAFVVRALILGLFALLLASPWIIHVLLVHGPGPVLAAAATSQHDLLAGMAVNLVKAVAINPFIAVGGVALLLRRDWLPFALLAVAVLITPRLAPQAWAIPIAILAGQGVLTAVDLLRRFLPRRHGFAVALVALAALAIVGARVARDRQLSADQFRPLDPDLRAGMAWVRATHPGARFVVLSDDPWYYDASAEWFPVLANARSLNTAQGREWLPDRAFARWVELNERQKAATCRDLPEAVRAFGQADYIWAETHRECFAAAGARPVYANADVAVFKVGN